VLSGFSWRVKVTCTEEKVTFYVDDIQWVAE
jgi:hypothetical protein